MLKDNEVQYASWQNRAFRFYVPARVLFLTGGTDFRFNSAAQFCGQQAIETLLKATVLYYDPRFLPKSVNHDWTAMIQKLKALGKVVNLPGYFHADRRMQTLTRYPSGLIPVVPNFLEHLDAAFVDLIRLVPFRYGTELKESLNRTRKGPYWYLSRRNRKIRQLRAHVTKNA
jgi:HEPN domain-containing protein